MIPVPAHGFFYPTEENGAEVEYDLDSASHHNIGEESAPRLRKPNDWVIFHNLVKLVERPLLAVEPADRLSHLVSSLPSSFAFHSFIS